MRTIFLLHSTWRCKVSSHKMIAGMDRHSIFLDTVSQWHWWAQSVDLHDPWIAPRNLWILTSRRNPWIDNKSLHYCNPSLEQTYMDRLVTFTNLYNPWNRITDRRRRNSRPYMEHAVTACSCRNPNIIMQSRAGHEYIEKYLSTSTSTFHHQST